MKLRIVWVGKTRNPHITSLCSDYAARIKRFLPLEITETKEDRILSLLESPERVVALDPNGSSNI
jgi:23S rRNA (pseudouridine1915-N3)-methyltransferase